MRADVDERNIWDKAGVRTLEVLTLAFGLFLEYGSESGIFPQTAIGNVCVPWSIENAGISRRIEFEYSHQPIVKNVAGQVAYSSENAAIAASKHAEYVARPHEQKSERVWRERNSTQSRIRLPQGRVCVFFRSATENWTVVSRGKGSCAVQGARGTWL